MSEKDFAAELRKWWAFDEMQRHTHSWHSREDFIERKLPELLRAELAAERERCAKKVEAVLSDHDPELGEIAAAAIRKIEK